MYCKNCGAKLPKDKDYCLRCGGSNQLELQKSIREMNKGDFQPALPMTFHYFYLILLFLSIVFNVYSMYTEGFSVGDVLNTVFSLILFISLGNRKKLGYILFICYTIYEMILLGIFYVIEILLLFGITTFTLSFVNLDIFSGSLIIFGVVFTALVIVAELILFAVLLYYRKRKNMFS